MRPRGLVAALGSFLLLGTLAHASPSSPPRPGLIQAPPSTNSDQVDVWNVSLRLVRSFKGSALGPNDWKKAFARMAEYEVRPDVISVLEVPWHRRGDVLDVIETKLGNADGKEYAFVHADAGTPRCRTGSGDQPGSTGCGNTMIVFLKERLRKICSDGKCQILRWAKIEDPGNRSCSTRSSVPDQIAVRLKDVDQDKAIVVASMHLGSGDPKECVAPNLKLMNKLIEADADFRSRPLSVVLGDFNEHSDPRSTDPDADVEQWRRETKHACWYKRFSGNEADGGCSITVGRSFSFPYYDTMFVENSDEGGIFCNQWTLGNAKLGGSNTNADSCSSRKKRIDYLWVRYETSDGSAIKVSDMSYARTQIAAASVDQGFFDPTPDQPNSGDEVRYSDHRALHARINWCAVSGKPTPCD